MKLKKKTKKEVGNIMGKGMSENGFYSENRSGNRHHAARAKVSETTNGSIAKEINEKKRAEEAEIRRQLQGNGKYIMNGSNDRVNGMEFNIWQYQTEDDQTSYWYGYTIHGGRRLLGVVEALEKEGKYDEIAQIAERDYNHGIPREKLGIVANNSVYMEAYDKIASKGKSK